MAATRGIGQGRVKAGIETNDDCEDYIVLCESSPTGLTGYAIVVDLTDEQVQLVREFETTRKRYNEMVHRVKLTDDLLRSLLEFYINDKSGGNVGLSESKCWRSHEFRLVNVSPWFSQAKRIQLTPKGIDTCQAILAVAAQYAGTQVEGNESELVKLLDDPDVGPHMLEAGRAKALEVAA